MSRTLASKFKFVVVVLAVLAMMIPAAIPVSAAPTLHMYLVNPMTGATDEIDGGYNVKGSEVYVTSSENVSQWQLNPGFGVAYFSDYSDTDATVIGDLGEVQIGAKGADNVTTWINKKWDMIDETQFLVDDELFDTTSGATALAFNQTGYSYGEGSITDTVWGETYENPLQGVILNWFLVDNAEVIDMTAGEADALKTKMSLLTPARFTQFIDATAVDNDPDTWLGTELSRITALYPTGTGLATVTDIDGASTVNFAAWADDQVKIVVIPEYPSDPQEEVIPEVAYWTFTSGEYTMPPQVRWVGEKIVLEKNFTEEFYEYYANFVIVEGEGALEQIGTFDGPSGFNWTSNGQSVWTEVNEDGVANVILTASAANEIRVRVSLYYPGSNEGIVAQAEFPVYFLKLESLHLSDVPGKRTLHNDGTWEDPVNPYNESFPFWADESEDGYTGTAENPDVTVQDRNISQDALERAQVKGWFMGNLQSIRDEALLDVDGDGEDDIYLPKYRWVLPDDWDKLAKISESNLTNRMFWDIMDAPNDMIVADYDIGPYYEEATPMDVMHSGAPVIGPFTPGIELMTTTGWVLAVSSVDLDRQYTTVVPSFAVADEWDAPMPPAKITFKINEGNGFFKEAYKGDIYISAGQFTNPFYYAMIPAHWAIPAFNSEANYKWDSFDDTYGEYMFWEAISAYNDADGDLVEMMVYSDNHGEAMVWLNGDANVDFDSYNLIGGKQGIDAVNGQEVGITEVQAIADYPYFQSDMSVASNTVEKTWYWNGLILGIDNHTYANWDEDDYSYAESGSTLNILSAGDYTLTFGNANPDEDGLPANGRGTSYDKMVFVWARDRDALADGVLGARLDIMDITEGPYILATGETHAVSQYNYVTKGIYVDKNGFLQGTKGVRTSGTTGYCYFRTPTDMEKIIFEKNWATTPDAYPYEDEMLDADDFVVAGFDLYYTGTCDSTVAIMITSTDLGYPEHINGQVDYTINVNFGTGDDKYSYPLDDPIVAGDANNDGVVDAQDIAVIENMIMEIEDSDVNGDATQNGQINMGDVVKVIRMIRLLE